MTIYSNLTDQEYGEFKEKLQKERRTFTQEVKESLSDLRDRKIKFKKQMEGELEHIKLEIYALKFMIEDDE